MSLDLPGEIRKGVLRWNRNTGDDMLALTHRYKVRPRSRWLLSPAAGPRQACFTRAADLATTVFAKAQQLDKEIS